MANRHRCLLSFAALSSLACGSPPNTRKIDNSINVYIYAGSESAESPPTIDLEDPRVAVNEKELADVLGHPLRFEIDAAIAAKFGSGLHDAYIAALESATDALARCRQ
ncbi:MAG TPA: hypothetical protein VMG12_05760, partial [Polyangiaceae bacterium]|nr:hypothetical protein [Polyangiaceae bacterium]